MKKVSLIVLGDKKAQALKALRKLGILQIEITEGSGERLHELKERAALLESSLSLIGKNKKAVPESVTPSQAYDIAQRVVSLAEEKKARLTERNTLTAELERLKGFENFDPQSTVDLLEKGIEVSLYEIPKAEYQAIDQGVQTIKLSESKKAVKCLSLSAIAEIEQYKIELPRVSLSEMRRLADELSARIETIDQEIHDSARYTDSIKNAIKECEKEIELEVYTTGMPEESLPTYGNKNASVAYFKGFVEAENVDKLKAAAEENSWGLLIEDPTEEDNTPTKLKNNRFVSLIYPLTDFLGTVPGYFEYDISSWFLFFILIFFGIIFGDGGYGLLICAVAAVPLIKSLVEKKPVSPIVMLIELFGLSTLIWGTVTCTWFGLAPEQLPTWLQKLSVPLISNVYSDKIWYPFWTNGTAGLTKDHNLQIFCFSLALFQLSVAHVKGAIRNKKSAKMLGDIGSIFELFGIFYLVLSFVVNAEVFSFGLVIGGVPVGTVAIALIAIGFCLNFVFANYEGSIGKSILASLKNIVSVLLGVVNVFSDIVSYIRLWAVGLAGAAISATVNELAGPLLGKFMFMLVAIFILIFGHGLNMILNVLSVIVHGIRLNTLEFSTHLDMSWSGRKFKPFKE